MTTTPLWVPVLVAVIGVLGTIVGTVSGALLTQRRSDRREREGWSRERERERERWEHEDTQRTFEARRAAYVDFYDALQLMARQTWEYGCGLTEESPFAWSPASLTKLNTLRVYASPEVAEAAAVAHEACMEWMRGNEDHPGYQDRYEAAERKLRTILRADLHITRNVDDEHWRGIE